MNGVTIRPFDDAEARAVASWRYDPPYDIYDGDPTRFTDYLSVDADGYGFYALTTAHDVVGFCCFGGEARVTGQLPVDGVVDIGGGLRPDLVSQGIATHVFPLIIEFAIATFRPAHLRTAVASFNQRSTQLCVSAGFEVVRRFDGPGCEFQELIRSADRQPTC